MPDNPPSAAPTFQSGTEKEKDNAAPTTEAAPTKGENPGSDPKAGEANTPAEESSTELRSQVKLAARGRGSLVWLTAAAWLFPLTTPVAAYDRLVLIAGAPSGVPRGEYLAGGGEPYDWGFLHGPGRWVRDTVKAAWETGQTDSLFAAVLLGLLPLVVMEAGTRIDERSPGAGRIFTWAACGGAAMYIAFLWHPQWWEVYMTALTALAWWGFRITRKREAGLIKFLLNIPIAALITGALMYSPGAVF